MAKIQRVAARLQYLEGFVNRYSIKGLHKAITNHEHVKTQRISCAVGKQVKRAVWRPRFTPPYRMMGMGYGGLGPFGRSNLYNAR